MLSLDGIHALRLSWIYVYFWNLMLSITAWDSVNDFVSLRGVMLMPTFCSGRYALLLWVRTTLGCAKKTYTVFSSWRAPLLIIVWLAISDYKYFPLWGCSWTSELLSRLHVCERWCYASALKIAECKIVSSSTKYSIKKQLICSPFPI